MSNAFTPAAVVSDEFGSGVLTLIISANTSDYNVRTAFISKYGSIPSTAYSLRVTVNTGIVVSATSTSNAALTWGTPWTGTPTFTFTNNGFVIGAGGIGGDTSSASSPPTNALAGSAGGKAIELSGNTVTINNANGGIFGGGGGGGGGGSGIAGDFSGSAFTSGGGGGGGPGSISAAGGSGSIVSTNVLGFGAVTKAQANVQDFGNPFYTITDALGTVSSTPSGTVTETISVLSTNGGTGSQSGGTASPGAAGLGSVMTGTAGVAGGNGGAGAADFGAAGSAGASAVITGAGTTVIKTGGAGGAAGKAINLTGGTANFASGSGSPHVKGAVS